jgi:long-chain acyl-CoA synthetase
MNVATLLRQAAARHGSRPAITCGAGETWATYDELAATSARLATGLRQRAGGASGGRVAVAMANDPAFIEVVYGAWTGGQAVVPMNAKLHPKEMAFIIGNCGARVCVATPEIAAPLAAALGPSSGVEIIGTESGEYAALRVEPEPMALAQDVAPTDLAWLFYTSGTTGQPKGAMLSHRSLLNMSLNYVSDMGHVACTDTLVHAAPMSHASGLYMLPHVAKGAANLIPPSGSFDADELLRILLDERAQRQQAAVPPAAAERDLGGVSMFLASTMVMRLVAAADAAGVRHSHLERYPLLKLLTFGGGPMYARDLRKAVSVLGPSLAGCYGQGESPMTIATLSKDQIATDTATIGGASSTAAEVAAAEARLSSVGFPYTGVEVRVVAPEVEDGEEDEGAERCTAPLPAGEVGEIIVRGDSLMDGYYNNESATATALAGGWLWTGDLGLRLPDGGGGGGSLSLRDRSKDLIVSGGANIFPREVEEVLVRHPAVEEAAVIGVPDDEYQELAVAFVVVQGEPERAAKTEADSAATNAAKVVVRSLDTELVAELDALCLGEIARFKRPRRYFGLGALPKSNYGKVLKTALRELQLPPPS